MIRYTQSAFKHGYTTQDIEQAIYHPVAAVPIATDTGASGMSVIGFAGNGEAINVRYQRDSATGEFVVFHAQKAPRGTRRMMP